MRKRLEKKYKVSIDQDMCIDSGARYWIVHTEDFEKPLFSAWTLKEVKDKLVELDSPEKR